MDEDKFPRMRLSPSPDRLQRLDRPSRMGVRVDVKKSGTYERLGGSVTPRMDSPITPIMVTSAFNSAGRRSPSPDSARVEMRPFLERARKRMSPPAAPAPVILPAYQPPTQSYESPRFRDRVNVNVNDYTPSPVGGTNKVTILTPHSVYDSPTRTRTPGPLQMTASPVSVPPATISGSRVVDTSNMDVHSMCLRVVQPVWHGQKVPPHHEWNRPLYESPTPMSAGPKKTPTPVETQIEPVPPPQPVVQEPSLTMDEQVSDRHSDRYSASGTFGLTVPNDKENCSGSDFMKQLFLLRGIDDPAIMDPFLSDQRLCDDWSALGKILVPLVRYGLRNGPQRKWLNVMPFVDKHRRLFPWLIWFNSPTLEGDYADMCPLNELRSFKAGTGASTDPAFEEYRDGDGILGPVIDGYGNRDPNVKPKRVKFMLQGCMILTFRDRVVHFHCNRVPEFEVLGRVLSSAVRINRAAMTAASPGRTKPGSTHAAAAVRDEGLTWDEYFRDHPPPVGAAHPTTHPTSFSPHQSSATAHPLVHGAAMNSVHHSTTAPRTTRRTGTGEVRGGTV
eukprot:TRINITY_DN30538_c0_g1_i1.p1 TRINITY_DN30538_c0_g1~~TRINITY_DN30538_c0_g1_i1.p1  ORF type:complete len:581 (+),score=82.67 TRINITY_DN30538_c0_g1_i1:65-1744(+)